MCQLLAKKDSYNAKRRTKIINGEVCMVTEGVVPARRDDFHLLASPNKTYVI